MGPTWEYGLTLDRIDNSGPYCFSNCQWSTQKEQVHNAERFIFTDEELFWIEEARQAGMLLKDIGKYFGKRRQTVHEALKRGRRDGKTFP